MSGFYKDPLADKLSKQKDVGSFNTKVMGNELAEALEYDRKYYLTDEMKKRAITKAQDYDEFKNLVACADLKPLSSKEVREIAQGERHVNKSAVENRRSRVRTGKKTIASQNFQTIKPTTAPQSASEFERNWSRHCPSPQEKFEYLKLIVPINLAALYRTELDAGLMMQIISTLAEQCQDSDCAFGSAFMDALTTVGRFDLNIKFFAASEKACIAEFFDKISAALADPANHSSIFGEDFSADNVDAIRTKWNLEAS